MRSATARSLPAALLATVAGLLLLAGPAAAAPDHDGGSGCPENRCENIYGPDPSHEPGPPAHGDDDSSGDSGGGGCCGGTHAPTHAPEPTHAPAPAPEAIVVVPAQPVPAQPR